VLADFGGFREWAMGGMGEIKVQGDGPGMIRQLTVPDMGDIAERLDSLDEATHTIRYSLAEGRPLGMVTYNATVTLVGSGNGCQIHWRGEYDGAPGDDLDKMGDDLRGSYVGMSGALETFVQNK
jgi:hypothetical protein